MQKLQPWLDHKGNLKNAFQIKWCSRNWRFNEWRGYENFLISNRIIQLDLWRIYLNRFEKKEVIV